MQLCKSKLLLLLLCLNTPLAFSEELASPDTKTNFVSSLTQGHVVFELGGYQGTQGNNNQHINIQNLIGDTFTVSDRHSYNATAGIGYFINGNSFNRFNLSYGLNAYYLVNTLVTGDVIQEDLFANLTYSYNVASFPIYAVVKSDVNLNSNFALTVNAGIGPNFMHVYNFGEKSADGGITIPEQPFSSHTTTNFSATAGVGIKMNFGQFPVELGYHFFYLGQGHMNSNDPQVLGNLGTGTVYANSIDLALEI